MIAALMASTDVASDDSPPTYINLARAGASLKRTIVAASCARLALECISLESLQARIAFGFDAHRRIRATGDIRGKCSLSCQLCLEPQNWQIEEQFELLLAPDETQARRWVDESGTQLVDVVVVGNAELDLVELIEDEVILRLPSQVCVDADCCRRPQLDYGSEEVQLTQRSQPNPFAELGKLK